MKSELNAARGVVSGLIIGILFWIFVIVLWFLSCKYFLY